MTIYSLKHVLYSKLLLLHAEGAILNNVSSKKIRQQIICFAIAFERELCTYFKCEVYVYSFRIVFYGCNWQFFNFPMRREKLLFGNMCSCG